METGKIFMDKLCEELLHNKTSICDRSSFKLAMMKHDTLQNTIATLLSTTQPALTYLNNYLLIHESLQNQCSTTSCNITNQYDGTVVRNKEQHNVTTNSTFKPKCKKEDKQPCLADVWKKLIEEKNSNIHIGGKKVTRGTKNQTKIIKTINGIKYQRKEVRKEDYDKYITKSTKQKQNMKCVYRVYKGKFYKYIPIQNREIIEVAKISNVNQSQIKKMKK